MLHHAVATLTVNRDVVRQVLVIHVGTGERALVTSMERVSGALVGTHRMISRKRAELVKQRLVPLAAEWQTQRLGESSAD